MLARQRKDVPRPYPQTSPANAPMRRLERFQRKCSGFFAVWTRDSRRRTRYTSVRLALTIVCFVASLIACTGRAQAEGDWEMTPESERALSRGLDWLAENQGPEGNWKSNDLGLVGIGALAFLADGHMPKRGRHGRAADRALNYVLANAQDDGLLNIADQRRDMYNHGLATFVLGQAHGMTNHPQLNLVLDRALKLIANTQCDDGGWDYTAKRQARGHDLSLAVMQAKALRSAVDSGLEVPPEVVELAIKSVREHYSPSGVSRSAPESEQMKRPGQFTYSKGGSGGTIAMSAAGVVCMQEFGEYGDWRIAKNMEIISAAIDQLKPAKSGSGEMPFDPYTLYYVGQALYQVGGPHWQQSYPKLRDYLTTTQVVKPDKLREHGRWLPKGHVSGEPGEMYSTAVACFILAMPNRYLPILQEGKIEAWRQKYSGE
jgi:hypothetical protein